MVYNIIITSEWNTIVIQSSDQINSLWQDMCIYSVLLKHNTW